MDATARIPPSEAPSLGELRERHLALLREWNQQADAAQLPVDQAEQLRAAAEALGAWLDDAEERDRAQGIIDYWTAAITGAPNRAFPALVRLAPYDDALPQVLVGRAEAIVAPYAGTALEDDVEAMLLCLVRPGPRESILCRAPVDRADLLPADAKPETAAQLAKLLDAFVDARIMRRVAGETPDEDHFEFMYGSVARAWPRLHALLEGRRSANETRDKLRATAQLWRESNSDSGYLLAGSGLDEATKYAAEDELLGDFIRASRHAQNRRRNRLIWAVTLGPTIALVVLALAIVISGRIGINMGFTRGESENDLQRITASETPRAAQQLAARPAVAPGTPLPEFGPESPALVGIMWAGTSAQSHLYNPRTGVPVPVDQLREGIAYRLRADVAMRDAFPDPEYHFGVRLGIAPAGSLVVANGPPQSVQRPSRTDYWLRVRLIPRVSMTYAAAGAGQADTLAARLRRLGYDITPKASGPVQQNQVYFYHEDEKGYADQFASSLFLLLEAQDGRPMALGCRLADDPSTGSRRFDLRIDPSSVRYRPEHAEPPPKRQICS